MSVLELVAQPLTADAFAPFGEVIECSGDPTAPMNDGHFDRFDDLCSIDVGADSAVALGIVRCRVNSSLPYRVEVVERHPLGTQAFIPLSGQRFVVAVAPPGSEFNLCDLQAFISNGKQGINYRRGTWHMPLIAFGENESFLVIDRSNQQANTEHCEVPIPVIVKDPLQ